MLERIQEQNVWDTIRESSLPIVVYGMGNGADAVFETLTSYGVDVDDVFASDQFVRGHSFRGHPVLKYSDICEKYEDFLVVMSFAAHDRATVQNIRAMNRQHTVLSPTIPIAGHGLFTREFVRRHNAEFDAAFALLADERSRQTYLDVLNFKISGKIDYLFHCESSKDEVYRNLLNLNDDETIVDLGAYDGDTIREFLQASGGKYHKIFALEPDSKNFKKLVQNTEGMENITCLHLGAWDKKGSFSFTRRAGRNSKADYKGELVAADTVDNLLNGERITLLKMDIEGSESKALEGAKNTLQTWKPKLYVCAYHRNEDMYQLPLQIHSYVPEYRFHFRHHPYIPAWESNFYAYGG